MITIVGNCQSRCLALGLGLALPDETITIKLPGSDLSLARGDIAVIQSPYLAQYQDRLAAGVQLIAFPSVVYGGYHPDIILLSDLRSPIGGWHSALITAAFRQGLTAAQTEGLFRAEVFDRVGFFESDRGSSRQLLHLLNGLNYPAEAMLANWRAAGCFMHGINHTKLVVGVSIITEVLARMGASAPPGLLARFLVDPMQWSASWPVYPEIASTLGVSPGDYLFKAPSAVPSDMGKLYDLPQMIAASFASLATATSAQLTHPRFEQPGYQDLTALVRQRPKAANKPPNPYSGLPQQQFWRQSMAEVPMGDVDPVIKGKFQLTPDTKIATAGSCFAQHIARHLQASGYHYLNAEPAPDEMPPALAEQKQYGLFSARFGNLYTTRQLRQMLDRAYGLFQPQDSVWQRADHRMVDPFRPSVEPEGFADAASLEAERQHHFAAIRHMFETLDVFVFTLGLTEAWRARADGAVFPLAPGVAASTYDPQQHEFINFNSVEVAEDLRRFWRALRRVNPTAKMILTVSPVPLAATYENRHVLVSTTASKAALRCAAEALSQESDDIAYFPSYEIITGTHAGNCYFDKDLRNVRAEGVAHVMRLFMRHYTQASLARPDPRPHPAASTPTETPNETTTGIGNDQEAEMNLQVICDEARLALP